MRALVVGSEPRVEGLHAAIGPQVTINAALHDRRCSPSLRSTAKTRDPLNGPALSAAARPDWLVPLRYRVGTAGQNEVRPAKAGSIAAPVVNQLLIRPSANQVSLLAGHHEPTSLVMYSCRKSDHSRPSIGGQFVYFQRRVKRITDEDRMTELRGLIQKPDQTVLHQEREFARPCRSLNQHLVTMRQHVRHPSAPTIFDVIMDRMIVPARRLES
jgi:hypothetical protein